MKSLPFLIFFNFGFRILYSNYFLSAKKSLEKENPTKDEFKKQLLGESIW
jgi:hypothetical protein